MSMFFAPRWQPWGQSIGQIYAYESTSHYASSTSDFRQWHWLERIMEKMQVNGPERHKDSGTMCGVSFDSFLTITRKLSVMTGTLLYISVHVNVILNLQERCTSLWFMSASFSTYRRDVHPFGSCERHSQLTGEMYIPLVHVSVILNLQERCTSLWFMWTSFSTYRRDVHPFGSCERHSQHTGEMYIPLVHVSVILNLQERCTSLSGRYQWKTLFVVAVSINWAIDRNWLTNLHDTWKVTRLNLFHQKWFKNTSQSHLVIKHHT